MMMTAKRLLKASGVALAFLLSTTAHAQWQGSWDTTFGAVKLQQHNRYVFGDYGTWGTIEGLVSENKRTMRGIYRRNDDGSSGFFEGRLGGTSQFAGRWDATTNAFPKWNSGGYSWAGNLTSTAKPTLNVYSGTGSIAAFIGARGERYINWIRAFDDPITGSLASDPVSNGLNYGRLLTPSKLMTAYKMQQHVEAISKKGGTLRSNGEAESAQAFDALGYNLLGKGIINETGNNVSLLRAAVAKRGDTIVVSFRGTGGDTFVETITSGVMIDSVAVPVQPNFIPADRRGSARVHAGFQRSYLKLRSDILAALRGQNDVHLFITGHSLGGAMATLMAWDMATNYGSQFKTITNITSGTPRVGNAAFKAAYESAVTDNLRIIANHDPVPAVPWFDGTYVHAGKALVIGVEDGVLLRHEDIDVFPNARQFPKYHSNANYKNAVRQLAQSASKSSRLSPDGETWASDAAASWYRLSRETRGSGLLENGAEAVQNGAEKVKDGAKGLLERGRKWLDKKRDK
jgi:pimeloyl-ACP methyl ester carboxylesterase